MSTIVDKLNRLAQYKLDIKNSIISKGQTVGDNMSEFADAISKISGGVEIPEILDTDPLTFVRVDNATVDGSISIVNNGVTNTKQFQYNKNDNGWTDYIVGDIIHMDYGDKVQFRSNDTTDLCTSLNAYRNFKTIGLYDCGGTLASLMNNNTTISLHSYCFNHLFYYCNIVNAPILPWEHINSNCYDNMFTGCTSLVNAPALPATTLANYCYQFMFQNCTSLVNAPSLPATKIASNCYKSMFQNCTSLVNAHKLPATTLASNCYSNMFNGCTSLVNAPELPATTLADGCYDSMFYSCTSLVNAHELPATTLAYGCYSNMFNGCTSLVNAPALHATTLASNCYQFMFQNCTSLVNAPELPATTLASNCYQFMFTGCTSLVNAPELPATTLASNCYYYMFGSCTKLNTIKAKCMYSSGTTLITSSISSSWLFNVSPKGTFYKNPDWSGPTSRGPNTIPSDWTIVDWV